MLKHVLKVLIVVCVISLMIQGDSFASSKQKDPCQDAETQTDLNDCVFKEYKKADARLNRMYKRIMKKLEPAEKSRLLASQRAWLKYRDAIADELLERGGSAAPMRMYGAMKTATLERIKFLKWHYETEGVV
ncbi:MAG: DUF1311 domain-containing protein [Acidobacteria bacterium]|nr:DUF1311 domain-containing protein [Acidobacteriota bacterium]